MTRQQAYDTHTNARESSLSSSRIGYIDALKGFAAVCVTLGHVISRYLDMGIYPDAAVLRQIFNLIYSFHMPLFMMISGYVYYTAYFDGNGRPDRKRIIRRVCNLIGVYVIFSIARVFSKEVAKMLLHREVVPADITLIAVKPIETLWYLYVLILLYLIFSIMRLTALNKWAFLGILAMISAYRAQLIHTGWFSANNLLYYALFFFIGMAYRDHKTWIIGNKALTCVLGCACAILLTLAWNGKSIYQGWIVGVITALGVSQTAWYMFEHVDCLRNCSVLKVLGRYSLEIYVLHIFFIAGLTEVFLRIGPQHAYLSVVLNTAISLAASVLTSELCYKLNIHGLFFKPFTFFRTA